METGARSQTAMQPRQATALWCTIPDLGNDHFPPYLSGNQILPYNDSSYILPKNKGATAFVSITTETER